MTVLPYSAPLAHSAPRSRRFVIPVVRELIARLRRRRKQALAIAHLKGLPDYLLADIGLIRVRVSPLMGDPYLVRWQRHADLW